MKKHNVTGIIGAFIILSIAAVIIYFLFKLLAPILPYVFFLIGCICAIFIAGCSLIIFGKAPELYWLSGSSFAAGLSLMFILSIIIGFFSLYYSIPRIF